MGAVVDLNALRYDVAGKLEAEGVTVALDPRDVTPPVVVIGLPVVTGILTPCAYSVDLDVTAVAPGPGNLDAIDWLLDTVAVVLATLDVDTATPTSFDPAPGSGANPLAAYVCTVTTQAT